MTTVSHTKHPSTLERDVGADHVIRFETEDGAERLYLTKVKAGARAMRAVQGAFLDLATMLTKQPSSHGVLALIQPTITRTRLLHEWDEFVAVLRQDICRRLNLVVVEQDGLTTLRGQLPEQVRNAIWSVIEAEKTSQQGVSLPTPTSYLVVLKILLVRWFTSAGLTSTKDLMKLAGCSYPTAASALAKLERYIERGPKKAVGLARFPEPLWAELLAVSDRERATMRFVDSSGQPRSPQALLERLGRIDCSSVAVGGTVGAKHWYPRLDVHGIPRLDLSVHAPAGHVDLGFVERLDPALVLVDDLNAPTSLAVHFVRRAESLFATSVPGLRFADPVECLLDLYELRYAAQAAELLEHLIAGTKT